MENVYDTFIPEGFSSVNSYLFVSNPLELIEFLKKALFAIEINRSIDPGTGDIGNCILKIGDSCLMISQARDQYVEMRTAHYLFVDDVDELYRHALEHGAVSEFEPEDMDYNDRQAGILDPSGNYWWISKRLELRGYHE